MLYYRQAVPNRGRKPTAQNPFLTGPEPTGPDVMDGGKTAAERADSTAAKVAPRHSTRKGHRKPSYHGWTATRKPIKGRREIHYVFRRSDQGDQS